MIVEEIASHDVVVTVYIPFALRDLSLSAEIPNPEYLDSNARADPRRFLSRPHPATPRLSGLVHSPPFPTDCWLSAYRLAKSRGKI